MKKTTIPAFIVGLVLSTWDYFFLRWILSSHGMDGPTSFGLAYVTAYLMFEWHYRDLRGDL